MRFPAFLKRALRRGAKTTRAKAKVETELVESEAKEVEAEEVSGERERLFSNLDAETLKHRPGNLVGSVSLVAGTTVGAGVLALPAVTEAAGYGPSSAVICLIWLYSCVTGLLLAEVNLWLMCELGRGGVSMLSMARNTFGEPGKVVAGGTYLFLHYC